MLLIGIPTSFLLKSVLLNQHDYGDSHEALDKTPAAVQPVSGRKLCLISLCSVTCGGRRSINSIFIVGFHCEMM